MNNDINIEDNKIKDYSKSESNVCKERNSSFELLRIIAMIMIIFHHFEVYGRFCFDISSITIPRLWCNFIVMGGKIGVNIFVLISGYFLIKNEGTLFNYKKILKLWGQVIFYSVGIYIVFLITGGKIFELKSFIKTLFPFSTDSWWFASRYLVLFLLSPFLNLFLKSISKKTYQAYLIIVVMWCSLIPTFINTEYKNGELWWFIILYSIAGYIRLYGFNKVFKASFYFITFFIFSILTYMLCVVYMVLGTEKMLFAGRCRMFYDEDKVTILLISLTLFLTFTKIKINYSKIINTIASATFGVYLIHDNELVRDYIWNMRFRGSWYQDTTELIPFSIFAIVVVFVICTIIELVRKQVIEKPFMILVERYEDRLTKTFKDVFFSIKNFVFGK